MITGEADWLRNGFRWRDGERLIRLGPGAAMEVTDLVDKERLRPFALLTTRRAGGVLPHLTEAAAMVVDVPPGQVPDAAAAVKNELGLAPTAGRGRSRPRTLVALGGGRVVDVAKALAAAHGLAAVAVPTTLSGAEMTPFFRPLPGHVATRSRPQLVVNDPELAASQPAAERAASAMNALGHAMEALYMPDNNPVTSQAAVRAAALLAGGVGGEGAEGERAALALGALLAGYAIGATGTGFHHVLCQTVVRLGDASHAAVNAVLLPHTFAFMVPRAPRELAPLIATLPGEGDGATGDAPATVQRLAARSGVSSLRELGVADAELPHIAAAAAARPELALTPPPPTRAELLSLLEGAW